MELITAAHIIPALLSCGIFLWMLFRKLFVKEALMQTDKYKKGQIKHARFETTFTVQIVY